jgi:hypothetical protein
VLLFLAMHPVTVVIMLGPGGPGTFEQMVASARGAAAGDSLAILQRIPVVDRVILAGPPSALNGVPVPQGARPIVDPDSPLEPFHFGGRLSAIIARYGLSRVLYLGAGSMPLLPEPGLSAILRQISEAPGRSAITNNLHSTDWAAFTQAESIGAIAHWLDRDNALAWRLRQSAGYAVEALPPAAATRLDIDTPFDLQALALYAATPDHTRQVLARLADDLNLDRLRRAIQVLRTPGSRVTLIGRVSGAAVDRLAASAQCWTRVFSEERGMVSSRRWADRQTVSLVADHIGQVGEKAFVARLAQVSDLVLWDTRVYLAHHNRWPPAEERFASDLGHPARVIDDGLRRLTEAAGEASIPILLAGHNVVSGGLYALLEIAGGKSTGSGGALPRRDYQP